MLLEKFARGDVISFAVTPRDVDGNLVDPDTVTLHVNYLSADGRVDADEIAMAGNTAGVFSGDWNSGGIGALPGIVDWAIRTTNPDSASEGAFRLTANLANPD